MKWAAPLSPLDSSLLTRSPHFYPEEQGSERQFLPIHAGIDLLPSYSEQDMPEHHLSLLGNHQHRHPDQHCSCSQINHLHQQQHQHLSSAAKTFGNIVISIVGSGVLGLPYTFKRTGWLVSTLSLSVIAILVYYCMMLLVWSRKKLEKDGDIHVDSFSDLGFLLYGKWGRFTVDCMLVLSQGAFCVAYLIFIGENLASVLGSDYVAALKVPFSAFFLQDNRMQNGNAAQTVHNLRKALGEAVTDKSSLCRFFSSKEGYIWVVFPLEVALASIRTLTKLAPFSIVADLVNFGSMAVVMQQDVATIMSKGIASISMSQGLSTLPFAVGVAIYAYEGVALVLPLESSMKERKNFGRVLGLAMVCITTLYISFGLLGYLAFGDETLDIVTLNLGLGWKTAAVKIGLCIGLFFTFAVMMFPVHEVMEKRVLRGRSSMLLRASIVLVAALCAVAVPHFAVFLSLVGNSVCCGLAFVVPAVFHIKASRENISKSILGLDYLIIGFGVVYGVWGTISSLQDILSDNDESDELDRQHERVDATPQHATGHEATIDGKEMDDDDEDFIMIIHPKPKPPTDDQTSASEKTVRIVQDEGRSAQGEGFRTDSGLNAQDADDDSPL
ncbi:hypothetical protein L7F22_014016 [Adiantum nelumboides]|nr:hypothetical protein [Adiantum nelumboides]